MRPCLARARRSRTLRIALPLIVFFWAIDSLPGERASAAGAQLIRTTAPRRARIDLTQMTRATRVIPLALVTPAMAQNIGPGSHLIIDIPGAGTFGCTANFVWAAGTVRFLGAAGHCFIPEGTTATHGPGANYNASAVQVSVCVSNCSFGGQTGFIVTGDLVVLGQVAYARQTDVDGDVGNDFGIVTIPTSLASLIRPSEPVFGGPSTIEHVQLGQPVCHYGNGVIVGETFPTMGRVGIGGGSNAKYWSGDLVAAPGDSGSSVLTCVVDGSGVQGVGAAGVLTHLGVEAGLNQHGFVLGTTTTRAIEMAREAGLSLDVVFPQPIRSPTAAASRHHLQQLVVSPRPCTGGGLCPYGLDRARIDGIARLPPLAPHIGQNARDLIVGERRADWRHQPDGAFLAVEKNSRGDFRPRQREHGIDERWRDARQATTIGLMARLTDVAVDLATGLEALLLGGGQRCHRICRARFSRPLDPCQHAGRARGECIRASGERCKGHRFANDLKPRSSATAPSGGATAARPASASAS